jgi:hypothetical protein
MMSPRKRSVLELSLAAALLLAAVPARAQTFPPQSSWQPLPCGIVAMTDARRDVSGFVDERDLVGNQQSPAGLFAWDPTYFFLQLRVDGDPSPGGKLKPSTWGFELSSIKQPSTYSWLIALNGSTGAVEVYRNNTTTIADSPADPADKPPSLSYPAASNARIAVASDSRFGGDPDYLVSLAVPWNDLAPIGLLPSTPALVWAGSSSTENALDGDLACHDGGGAQLDRVGGLGMVFDVSLDSDGDKYPDWYEVRFGTDPASAASHPAGAPPAAGTTATSLAIEGGGGCRVAGGEQAGLLLAAGLLAALVVLRRRR